MKKCSPATIAPGVPLRVAHALDRLGRTDISSHRVSDVFGQWVAVCRKSRSELAGDANDWTQIIGPLYRGELERAIRVLPRRLGRELRDQLRPWDERFLAKTLPDPTADPTAPWWRRRRG